MGEVRAGHTLGRYELLVPIALGGMASVWAARMSGPLPKIVAVKLLRAELSDDPDFEAMFLDEATLVSQIHHENVAETLDAGEEDGVLYQVMELIDGEQLNLVLREAKSHGGLPLPVALRIVSEVCLGLHAAHELRDRDGSLIGLVHRDVSPQNLLISYNGAVKIVDFGVAKAASNLQMTRIGQIKGKCAYMAPEQASSQAVDRRSDIFALGIIFYQLTTGKHPFLADHELVTMRRICDSNPADPPRSLVPALPEQVEQIILKALAKPKEDRFATMLELHAAIEHIQPAQRQATADEVAALMARFLGPRGERRRAAIQEAMELVRSEGRELDDGPPRPPVNEALLPAIRRGARQGAVGAAPPSTAVPEDATTSRSAIARALVALRAVFVAAPQGRQPRFEPVLVICLASGLGLAFAYLLRSSIRGDDASDESGATAAVLQARSLQQPVQRVFRAARARAAADQVQRTAPKVPAR